jgi:hypothetical protein
MATTTTPLAINHLLILFFLLAFNFVVVFFDLTAAMS